MKAAFIKDNKRFIFNYSDNGRDNYITLLINDFGLTWENKHIIPVKENPHYTWKINKKSISASGGAYGLFKFLKRSIDNDFGMCWVNLIIESVCKW